VKKSALAAGLCLLAAISGCGRSKVDPPVDAGRAAEVLQTALSSWKDGAAYGDLPRRNPPIYFNEREWEAGAKLLKFSAGKVDLMGRQGRCLVKLSLQTKDGKSIEREISYLIDTEPRVVITREGLGP